MRWLDGTDCSGSSVVKTPFHLPVEFSDLGMTSPLVHCHFVLHFMVRNLPAMQETQVQSLGEEDPMEKEMKPFQYPCLENPMDKGACWAMVHGVTKSQTRLGC